MRRAKRSFSGKPLLHFCLSPAGVRYSQKEASATIRPIKDTPRRFDVAAAVDNLIRRDVNILFTIGGDGTQRGGNELFQQSKRRGRALSVVGIPKTVDNDVAFIARTFGHFTAVEEAVKVLDRAHTEARSVHNGLGLVKLMGRADVTFSNACGSGAGDVWRDRGRRVPGQDLHQVLRLRSGLPVEMLLAVECFF